MVDYVSRAEWGARPPEGRRLLVPSEVENVAIHWPGSSGIIDARGDIGFRRICSALRGWQNYHMDGRGWSDIAYQVAVDNVGRPYDLRGIRVQSGANGNQDVNERFGAILVILGPGERPTEAMCNTVGAVMTDYRKVFSRVPRRPTKHSSVRPAGTTCPGPFATEAIAGGDFDARIIIPPTIPEEDMALSEEDKTYIEKNNQKYALAVNNYVRQILGTATKAILVRIDGVDEATAARVESGLQDDFQRLSDQMIADAAAKPTAS